MQHRLIITKIVYGKRGTHTVTVSRNVSTLLGAMREGTRYLSRRDVTMVSVVDPVTNCVVKTRSRGNAKWTDVEVTNVSTHEEASSPD